MEDGPVTSAGPLRITAVAHEGADGRVLLLTLACAEDAVAPARPLDLSLVIDRSGSMSGDKLAVAKAAASEFVRSLDPQDLVSVVAYDDSIQVLAQRLAPNASIAGLVDQMQPGGSTDLYGGWVTGAKLQRPGGRVILLSDGHANVGRFTEADQLAAHARLSHDRYRIITSTVGVGYDYDEALMAGMARFGGGGHYFAHTAEAILEAFANERYAMGASVVGFVSVRRGHETVQLGQFWPGEVKRVALRIHSLADAPTTVRYRIPGAEHSITVELTMPDGYGLYDGATLQLLIQEAIELEAEATRVRDRLSAAELHERVRGLLLRVMAHPLADSEDGMSLRGRLEASMDRLERLRVEYREEDAVYHRKRSMQSSYNLREKGRAYSSFEDERELLRMEHASASLLGVVSVTRPEASLLAFAPIEDWESWCAVPVHVTGGWAIVATSRPRDGFLAKNLERLFGLRVRLVPLDAREVQLMLDEAKKPQ